MRLMLDDITYANDSDKISIMDDSKLPHVMLSHID